MRVDYRQPRRTALGRRWDAAVAICSSGLLAALGWCTR